MAQPEPRLLTIRELARALVVSERTIRRWTKDRRFKTGIFHGPGGGSRWIRYDLAEIRRQMAMDAHRRGRL